MWTIVWCWLTWDVGHTRLKGKRNPKINTIWWSRQVPWCNKVSPLLAVFCHLPYLIPILAHGSCLSFQCLLPHLFGYSSLSLSITYPMQGIFVMDSFFYLMKWLKHLHCLLISIVPMLSILHCCSRSLLEIVCGQKIHSILWRLLVWHEDNFSRSRSVIRQHSAPYKRVGKTQLQFGVDAVLGWMPHSVEGSEGITCFVCHYWLLHQFSCLDMWTVPHKGALLL